MNEPTKNVEQLSATIKSIEPKYFLLSKTVWGMIILAILVIAKWAGFNIDDSAGNAADVFEKIGAILVVLGLRTKSQPLTFKTRLPEGTTNLLMVCGLGLCMGSVVLLTSCGGMGGTAYRINTLPYQAKDRTIDDVVVVDAEDVEVIGGFSVNAGAKLLTDHGVVDISDKGINGEVVIDVRSGK